MDSVGVTGGKKKPGVEKKKKKRENRHYSAPGFGRFGSHVGKANPERARKEKYRFPPKHKAVSIGHKTITGSAPPVQKIRGRGE